MAPWATCPAMKTVSIRDAKNRLLELAREVEQGETIVVTRHGRPVFDFVPHLPAKGLRLEAIDEFKRKHGIETIVRYIADDFDNPLPEDFSSGRCRRLRNEAAARYPRPACFD
jgi:prevent-host-death family protein